MPQCLLPLIWLVDHPFGLLTPVDFSIYLIFYSLLSSPSSASSFSSSKFPSVITHHPHHQTNHHRHHRPSTFASTSALSGSSFILSFSSSISSTTEHSHSTIINTVRQVTVISQFPAGGVPGNFVSSRFLLWFALDSFLCTKQRLQRPLVVPLELPRTAQTEAVYVCACVCMYVLDSH